MRRLGLSLAILFLLACVSISNTNAQDIHFSQFNAAPIILNPALTGVNGSDYRVAANYRSQWAGLGKYNTVAASYDMALFRKTPKTNYGGIGVSLFSDRAGDLSLSTTQVNLSMSYTLMLNNKGNQLLTTGLIGGVGYRTIDYSKLTTDSQFGDQGYDPNLPTQENLNTNTKVYGDVGAGFLWSLSPNKVSNYYMGASAVHLSQPNLSFFGDRNEKLYLKVTIHGGAYFKAGKKIFLMPNFMFLTQGPHTEFTFGSMVKIKKSVVPSDKTAFYVGGYYRLKDAMIFTARVDFMGVNIGISYDVNLSKLTTATKANGGPEISIIYVGSLKHQNTEVLCPVI